MEYALHIEQNISQVCLNIDQKREMFVMGSTRIDLLKYWYHKELGFFF